jgi:hypothetical protein
MEVGEWFSRSKWPSVSRGASASGSWCPPTSRASVDEPDIGLPADRPLRSDDIDGLRFRAVSGLRGAIRGYRFGDVDAAMAQVRDTLRGYESEAEAGGERAAEQSSSEQQRDASQSRTQQRGPQW